MSAPAIQGRLVLSPHFVLFVGTGLCTRAHRHLSASITLSFDRPFRVSRGAETREARLMLMRPDMEHALDARDAHVVNLQLDPETELYARLRAGALHDRELVLDAEVDRVLLSRLHSACSDPARGAQAIVSDLLDRLGAREALVEFDPRVAQALSLLKQAFPNGPSSAVIAKRVGASESRLMHLFREQVGVPLRRYTLWLRLRHLLFHVAAGFNLTHAAHAAGFADSAHFARVFSAMFGVPPSALLRGDQVSRALLLEGPPSGPHAVQDAERIRQLLAGAAAQSAAS
ncbi:MAG TPA: AraC family transcriptional regulator [Polyangiaceae bacterium]|nr:AraC family transcriptional regulator [Polyangiaceae bacterium]